ncbi:MAG: hypothetical protein MOP51_710, partial [Citricoccus sp.]|nr:hypothetical protein [Citricoccus sp. WCRC_4]
DASRALSPDTADTPDAEDAADAAAENED